MTISSPEPADVCSTGALMLDAEALYGELMRSIRTMIRPGMRLLGVTSGGAWLAQRLQRDLALQDPVGISVRARGQEGAAAARQERLQPVLRELDAHPHHLRDRRQAPVGRRDQPRHQHLVGGQGRDPARHHRQPGADAADMFVVRHATQRRAAPDRPAPARRARPHVTWSMPATAAMRTRRRACSTCTPSATTRRTSPTDGGDRRRHPALARGALHIHALTTLGVPEVRAIGPQTLLPTGSSRWACASSTTCAKGLKGV
jgi:hypothetical protein